MRRALCRLAAFAKRCCTRRQRPLRHVFWATLSRCELQPSAIANCPSCRYAGMPKPQLLSIGLTVHSAPVALREQLSIPEAEWPRASAELTQYPHIEEAAVLSTCNRLELYAVLLSWHPGVREVEDWLCRTSGVPLEQLRPHLFLLREQDAAHHLLRVASGLDSLVLGEGQILAQVRRASQRRADRHELDVCIRCKADRNSCCSDVV